MARLQCWLAVVSCSTYLSTSATERLQALFLWPHTTLSRPISTRCNSKFRSPLSNEKRGHGSEDSTHWEIFKSYTTNVNPSTPFHSVKLLLHLTVKKRELQNVLWSLNGDWIILPRVWFMIIFAYEWKIWQWTGELMILLLCLSHIL